MPTEIIKRPPLTEMIVNNNCFEIERIALRATGKPVARLIKRKVLEIREEFMKARKELADANKRIAELEHKQT